VDDLSKDAIRVIRRCVRDGLGFNCGFVDDDVRVAVTLAQRAVLAGLASDLTDDMKNRMTAASEKQREAHEKELGRSIPKL
jgi:hypothetical protein